jgi:pimeloyl-ACP methyl ester carboxylesterase
MRHGSKTFVYLALIAFGLIASLLLAADVQAQSDGPAASPQAPTVTVSGQVRLGGAGEPGVIVELRSGVTVVASATTNGAGQYSLNAPAGILTLSARKGVYAFEPGFRRIFVLTGGAPITQDFAMTRPPIVIQGGYTPLSPPQSGCPQRRLDGSTYDPGVCGEEGFAELLADLRGAGWNVRTVMMNSSLLRTPALSTQTSALRRAINDAKTATGASKVILFAHSTGGPVARRYIESTLYAGDVSHLFTFGSQHMGNPIEDIADVWFNQIMPDYLRENTIVPEPLIGAMVAVIDFVIQDKVNFLCSTRLFQFTIPFVGAYNVPGPQPGRALRDVDLRHGELQPLLPSAHRRALSPGAWSTGAQRRYERTGPGHDRGGSRPRRHADPDQQHHRFPDRRAA